MENLRELVEKGEQEASELKKQAKIKDEMLAKAAEEVKKVETVCKDMVAKSEEIYQAYKKALATFGAEPLPLPPQAEGLGGVV